MQGRFIKASSDQEMLSMLGDEIVRYWNRVKHLGLQKLWQRSWRQYNSGLYRLGAVQKLSNIDHGDELLKLSINDYSSILRHLHVLVTKEPPYLDAKPVNSSSAAMKEMLSVNILLEYYQNQRNLDSEIRKAKFYELLFGSGFLVIDWDEKAGRCIVQNEKQSSLIREGDLTIQAYSPFDVIHRSYGDTDNQHWYIVRKTIDKYELEVRYDLQDDFQDQVLCYDSLQPDSFIGDLSSSDVVDVYTLYHVPTTKYPNGLRMVFTRSHILEKGPLPSGSQLPVARAINQSLLGVPFGTTIAFDLLEIQQAKDNLISTILNNQATFGLNSLIVPKNAGIEASFLTGRMQILEVEDMRQKPETLDLLKSQPEILNFVTYLENSMERISGINSIVRGQAKASQSGQALALITSMAIQFTNGYVRTYREIYKDAGKILLSVLKNSLPLPRRFKIIGKSGELHDGRVSSESLDSEYSIAVELISPLKSTAEGRESLASVLMENGLITDPRQYLDVLLYGRVDELFESGTNINSALRKEREQLISGEPIEIIELQNHLLYIKNAMGILDDSQYNNKREVVERVYDLISRRMSIWKSLSEEKPDFVKIINMPLYKEFFPSQKNI